MSPPGAIATQPAWTIERILKTTHDYFAGKGLDSPRLDAELLLAQVLGVNRVYLYTHWSGSELIDTLKAALKRGKNRWNDSEYLARIIFSEMVKGDLMAETGYGIGTEMHGDIEHPVPILDCQTQMISWCGPRSDHLAVESFAEFAGG